MTTDTALPLSAWAPVSSTSVVAGEQRHVAVGDEDGAAQLGGQGEQAALDGPAGALDVVLVGDDQVGVDARCTAATTRSRSWRTTTPTCSAPVARAARIAWPTRVTPPMGCRTLGVADFIRVPSPAARTMTAAGRGVLTREGSRVCWGCHGTPVMLPVAAEPVRGAGRGRHPP